MPNRGARLGVGVLALVGAGVVALLGIAALLLGAGRGGGHDAERTVEPDLDAAPTTVAAGLPASAPAGPEQTIVLDAGRLDADPVPVLGSVRDGDVLRIRVRRLEPNASGQVRQCLRTASGFVRCRNSFPVVTDAAGTAYFQYQVRDEAGRCGPAGTCVVVVGDRTGRTAFVHTVFGAPAPPPAVVRLVPEGPYRGGQRVEVSVHDVEPGTDLGISYCDPSCRRVVRVTVGPDGSAEGVVEVARRCDAGARCSIAVTGLGARDTAVPVRFQAPPAPGYDAGRLALGLAVAGALLLAAAWIVRRTDWRAPSEAAAPDLDAAEI